MPGEDDRWTPPSGNNPFGEGTPSHEELPGASNKPEQPGQTQWSAPAPVTGPTDSKDGNGKAVASLILGIAGLPICCPLLIPSILAIVFGHMAKGEMTRGGNTSSNRGMATAGIILGWIGIGLFVLGVLALIALVAIGDGLDLDDPDNDGVPDFIDDHPNNRDLSFIKPVLLGVGRGLGLA